MKTFPMFLKMTGRSVLICGGGEQAAQKCRLMLKTEAQITIAAPALDEELSALARGGRVTWHMDRVTVETFRGRALVFVATGCPGLDASLHALADEAGALINVVDQPELCDAYTPSIVDRDPVVVAIGTEGAAPVLGRQIKTRLEQELEPRLGDLVALAGRLRARAAARLQPRARRDLWRWVFNGPVREAHARGAEREAARMLKETIETGKVPEAQPAPVALVGAGPGCRDLITLRGVQRLQEADVIFYDRLVDPGLLELARRDAERVYVGKTPGATQWPQERINALLVNAAKSGQRVVRLKCGDPGIFARGAEEAEALAEAGIAVEIVPGVTAASAAAAAEGEFLTKRGRNDTLVLTTGHHEDGRGAPEWLAQLQSGVRVAVYMGITKASDIVAALDRGGLADQTEVLIVSQAETPEQQRFRCRASDLVATIADHQIPHPAMLFLSLDQAEQMSERPALRLA